MFAVLGYMEVFFYMCQLWDGGGFMIVDRTSMGNSYGKHDLVNKAYKYRSYRSHLLYFIC